MALDAAALSTVNPEIAARLAAHLAQDDTPPPPLDPNKVDQPTEAAPVEEPVEEEPIAAKAEEAPAETDPPAEEPEADATAEESLAGSGDEPEAPAEAEDVTSVAQLAALFDEEGFGEESILDLTVTGRDGESVTMRDALDHYRNGPSEDAQFQTRIATHQAELSAAHDVKLNELSESTAAMLAYTEHEFASVNWQELRETDPSEYIRLSDKRSDAYARMKGAIDHLEAARSTQGQKSEAEQNAWKVEQRTVISRLHPEWSEPEAGNAAMTAVSNYMNEVGFPAEMQESLENALVLNTVWEAAQYRRIQAGKPALRKRLRSVPKQFRATARAAEQAPREAQIQEHDARVSALSESGSVEDAASLFMEHL